MYNMINDNVLVELLEKTDMQIGDIVLPTVVKEAMTLKYATVLAVGPGKKLKNGERSPMEVCVGDTVVIGEIGNCMPVSNKEKRKLLVFKEASLAAVVEKDDNNV